ncbi:MAG: hypothetical protein DI585_01065 [Pseudomonas fluorescens]|nr:MAG: hypothetical protein DI585_01065 [Pseudomonas fluorescens]
MFAKVFMAVAFAIAIFVLGYVLYAYVPALSKTARLMFYLVTFFVLGCTLLCIFLEEGVTPYGILFLMLFCAGLAVAWLPTLADTMALAGAIIVGGLALGCVVAVGAQVVRDVRGAREMDNSPYDGMPYP